MDLSVRTREASDVPCLVELLTAQQPASRYPLRWPLPFPVEQFLVRATEDRAWVAELDGRLVGHVTIGRVEAGEMATLLHAGTDRDTAGLATVSVLFVDQTARGVGVGSRLLATAVDWARSQGRVPVLDVVSTHAAAVDLYRRRGWVEVASIRPAWLPEHEPDVLLMWLPDDA